MRSTPALRAPSSVGQVLRQHLEDQISIGRYATNSWLPSVRELAATMNVNRNTVSKVYQAMARDGIVEMVRGKGVRVVALHAPSTSSAERLIEAANALASQAASLGLTRAWFASQIERAASDAYGKQSTRVGFVECNDDDTRTLSRDLSDHLGLTVEPILLRDLEHDAPGQLAKLDILCTTFFHLQEVTALVGATSLELVGINHEVSHESILQIAQLKPASKIVVVCPNTRTLERVGRIVQMYARGHLVSCVADDPKLPGALREADVVIVTSSTQAMVADNKLKVPTIVVRFHIQPQSVEYLRTAVRAHARSFVLAQAAPLRERPAPARRPRASRTRRAHS
jgi:DNA-binding transcriptional regulator YhcF (GntR family)